jgi:hypothetical protein
MHRIIFYAVTLTAEQDQDIRNKKQTEDPDEIEIGISDSKSTTIIVIMVPTGIVAGPIKDYTSAVIYIPLIEFLLLTVSFIYLSNMMHSIKPLSQTLVQ